jgi:CheY-like chemotaxis protein
MSQDAPGPRGRLSARLMIVDDHELARAGLRSLLGPERGLEVVAEAATGADALALCRRHGPARTAQRRARGVSDE